MIHCHDFQMLETAVWARLYRNSKLIYDSHEYFAGSMALYDKKPITREILIWCEKLYVRKIHTGITVGDMIARRMEDELKISKVEVVRNSTEWDISQSSDDLLPSPNGQDPVILVYQGIITLGRGISVLIEIMRQLPTRYKLTLLGSITPEVKEAFGDFGDRVELKGMLSLADLQVELQKSHIGVYPIQDSCLSYRLCLPNKLFEAIACRLPVVFSDFPEIRSIVTRYKIGALVKADDPTAFAQTIIDAVEHVRLKQWRANSPKAFVDNNWSVDSKVLVDIYHRI